MDTPIEAFLTDVLGLQGESQTEIGGCVRDYAAKKTKRCFATRNSISAARILPFVV
jgi:hypothetical protein